jgi:hypothetical protein
MQSRLTRRQAGTLLLRALSAIPILKADRLAWACTNESREPDAGALLPEKTLSAPIYVALWFDTEDYLLPASDDAAKRIAEMFTREGLRPTFKVVGEKARVLEQRQRTDVIAALAQGNRLPFEPS